MASNEVSGEKGDLPFLHTWKLERLSPSSSSSGRNWHYSHAFHAGGYNWKLALYPGDVPVEKGKCCFPLFLAVVDATTLPRHLVVEVTVQSSILNGNDSHCSKKEVIYEFRESKSEECYPFLISLETLKCPSSGFLIVEILDVVVRTDKNEPLSPNVQNDLNVYTWTVDGFSKLTKAKYQSGPFLMKDHIWFLILYPRGNNMDNFISLYLGLDEASTLAPTDKVYAEFSLDWVDQSNGKDHGKRTSHHFNSKDTDWGFTRFMTLDDLHETSKGFLVNDSCMIKVVFS